ncbi:hypothetical protein GGS21DRAFT_489201 [Xylaria nigripes]|nr:hypothetical protein GGS21DRAFT_489201 [Xylaria nigripes]
MADCKTLVIHLSMGLAQQQRPNSEKIKAGGGLASRCFGIEDREDIRRGFEQAFTAAGLRTAKRSDGDFVANAMDLANYGFMRKLATRAPRPGNDGEDQKPPPSPWVSCHMLRGT